MFRAPLVAVTLVSLAEAALLALVWWWAWDLRVDWFGGLRLSNDWNLMLREANDMAMGLPRVTEPTFLYTSWPAYVLAAVVWCFREPLAVLQAWAALGALVAPLGYLAVRIGGGGPLAGGLAAVLLALAPWDIQAAAGIKTPYVVSTFSTLILVGLALGTRGRFLGPSLAIGGAAVTVAFQVGLFPLAFVVPGLVVVQFLTGRVRLPACLAAVGVGLAVTVPVLLVDAPRLLDEIAVHQAKPFPAQQGQPTHLDASWSGFVDTLAWAQDGMVSTTTSYQAVGVALVVGLLALVVRLVVRRRGVRSEGLVVGFVGLQAAVLAAAAVAPYLELIWRSGYGEQHHYPPVVPMVVVAAALLGAGAAPGRWVLPRWLFAAVAPGVWLWSAYGAHGAKALNPLTGGDLPEALSLGQTVREHARAAGRPPIFFGRVRGAGEGPAYQARVVSEFARLGWVPDEAEPICYLYDRREHGGELLLHTTRPPRYLSAFDDCAELTAQAESLCVLPVWTRRHQAPTDGTTVNVERQVLPCAAWHP